MEIGKCHVFVADGEVRIEFDCLSTFFDGPFETTSSWRREARQESVSVDVAGVFPRPRVQDLSTEFQVSGQLPVVSESDVVILQIADATPQFVSLGYIFSRKFGFPEVGDIAAQSGITHRKIGVELDGAPQQ